MNIIKYIILGIIQGITEPLPISSSGHLILFRELFNTNIFNDLNFESFVNFGSFIAIFIIFYDDIIKLIKGFMKYIFSKNKEQYKKEWKYCWLIIIGSIPAGIVGLLFKDSIEQLATIKEVGFMLIITAIALFLVRKTKGLKKDYEITFFNAIIIGFFQMFALLPGLSRSGMVLVGCLLCGLSKNSSLKYTFMLYFPVSIASFLISTLELIESEINSNLILNYGIGLIFALITTYYSYSFLSNVVNNNKLWKFSIYCIIVSTFILIYFR